MYPRRNKPSPTSGDRVDDAAAGANTAPLPPSRDSRCAGTQHSQSASMDLAADAQGFPGGETAVLHPSGPFAGANYASASAVHYRTSSQLSGSNGRLPGIPDGAPPPYLSALPTTVVPPSGSAQGTHGQPGSRTSPVTSVTQRTQGGPTLAPVTTVYCPTPTNNTSGNGGATPRPTTSGPNTPQNDVVVQEMRYAHLYEEYRKLQAVVRDKNQEMERGVAERKRLQTELDFYRVELAAQRRNAARRARAVRSDLLRLVTLVDVLLSDRGDTAATSTNEPVDDNTEHARRAAQLRTAYHDVEQRLASLQQQQSQSVDGSEGKTLTVPNAWVFDTLNLSSFDLLTDAVVDASGTSGVTDDTSNPSLPSTDALADSDSRLDAIQEAREAALKAVEGLAHYLAVLDFGFPAAPLTSGLTTPALSVSVNNHNMREALWGAPGRPVVPILPDTNSG